MPKRTIASILTSAFLLALAPLAPASDCTGTSVGLIPLTDLGTDLYLGQFEGGLYAGGLNAPPLAHRAAGLARAQAIEPLDADGQPSPDGHYVLLSIGMSNTTQEFCSGNGLLPCAPWTFMGQALEHPDVNHDTLKMVNGARGGQTAVTWDDPADANYDRVLLQDLAPQGLSEAQVQIVWAKLADAGPTVSLPAAGADAYQLEAHVANVARAVRTRYPNCRLMLLSSRIYAGYADTALNPEPYAYESGFAVKWLIDAQIEQMAGNGVDPECGDLDYNTSAPWLAWGPYLWADGTTPRGDGLNWLCSDFQNDGTHPATEGEEKVGSALLQLMLNSPVTRPWFRATAPCTLATCSDDDVCTFDACVSASCLNLATPHGDIAAAGPICQPDGEVDLFDIFRILDAFGGNQPPGCSPQQADISGPAGCTADGTIDLHDIFAVLDAFQGIGDCCP